MTGWEGQEVTGVGGTGSDGVGGTGSDGVGTGSDGVGGTGSRLTSTAIIQCTSFCPAAGDTHPCEIPYQYVVPSDPTREDMKKAVVMQKLRPPLDAGWKNDEVSKGGLLGLSLSPCSLSLALFPSLFPLPL